MRTGVLVVGNWIREGSGVEFDFVFPERLLADMLHHIDDFCSFPARSFDRSFTMTFTQNMQNFHYYLFQFAVAYF